MARKKAYKAYSLPPDFNNMEEFILNNKELITEKVLDSIEYALTKKLQAIEVFHFANSEFVVVLSSDKFQENIDGIYNYYIKEEKYELCPRIKTLETKISKLIKN